jgi:hypothetical protein
MGEVWLAEDTTLKRKLLPCPGAVPSGGPGGV